MSTTTEVNCQSISKNEDKPIYFEARKTLNTIEEQYFLENDVLVISPNSLITADKVNLDLRKKIAYAQGHVLGIISNKVIVADKAKVNLRNHLFHLEKGSLIAGDSEKINLIKGSILDFKLPDPNSDENKANFLKHIQEKKNLLYRKIEKSVGDSKDYELIISQYEVLLEQESLLKKKSTLIMSSRVHRRYELWKRLLSYSNQNFSLPWNENMYFRIKGDSLIKLEKDLYKSLDSVLSFCRCDEDESPAWALRSSKLLYKTNDYASLHNSVLEIKSFPVAYLPYIRLPLNSERKIGLLPPSFSFSQDNGLIYTQDFYIPNNEHSDTTIGYEYLEKRGVKLKTSYRALWSRSSFFDFSFEALRDKKWVVKNKERKALLDFYEDGFSHAYKQKMPANFDEINKPIYERQWWEKHRDFKSCFLSEGNYNECLNQKIKSHLAPSDNKNRGKINWRGQYQLSEGLSFIAKGMLTSDHRYNQDLDRGELLSYLLSSAPTSKTSELNGIINKVNLTLSDFSISLYSKIFDPIQLDKDFLGYQLPIAMSFRSRYFSLFNFNYPRIYVRFLYQFRKINQFYENEKTKGGLKGIHLVLGDGYIGDVNFDISVPLVYNQVFSLKYFFELEGKHLFNEYIMSDSDLKENTTYLAFVGNKSSYLGRFKTGVNFSLPLEGQFSLGQESLYRNALTQRRSGAVLEHRMSWNLGLHYFSYPAIKGAYGNTSHHYILTDKSSVWKEPEDIKSPITYTAYDRDFLISEKTVSFGTTHSFIYSKRVLTQNHKNRGEGEVDRDLSPYRKQALKELFVIKDNDQKANSLDQNMGSPFLERKFDSKEFATFRSDISYDFEKQNIKNEEDKKRLKDSKAKRTRIEPLSPLASHLVLKWGSHSAEVKGEYNFYLKNISKITFTTSITLPFSIVLSPQFSIQKTLKDPLSFSSFETVDLTKKTLNVKFGFLKNSSFNYSLELQQIYGEKEISISKGIGLQYLSPSDCWGLVFSWSLPINTKDSFGVYQLSFFVKFTNNRWEFGNLASYFLQEDK